VGIWKRQGGAYFVSGDLHAVIKGAAEREPGGAIVEVVVAVDAAAAAAAAII
jgi:hypothetical protein